MASGNELIDYGMSAFGMNPEHWSALQAIHGVVHSINGLPTKYTWIGSGYISNTYFKLIANKPMYEGPQSGGDQTFTDCHGCNSCIGGWKDDPPLWVTFGNFSTGGMNGEPIANNGW